MVQKSSHRGVHSGNTLRASNCRYSRRYHNQACIISRVRPELLQKLLGDGKTKEEKKEEGPKNVAVNVALSLNKQSRWLLPSALIQQVKSNDIAKELTVSVMERHKLKRPASCISFHSNKGEVKRIQPRKSHYFCYNFPPANGKSRREVKREKREELLEQLKANKVDSRAIVGKAVEVFTEQGHARLENELGASEVRYEVYYPAPAHSSISHNPKYIKQNVDAAPGDNSADSEHVQNGKPKKHHRARQRKRMSVKDIDDFDLPAYDWGRVIAADIAEENLHANLNVLKENEVEISLDSTTARAEQNTTECLLSSLIEKAERLQRIVEATGKLRRTRRKSGGSKNGNGGVHDDVDSKPHIVYLNEKSESETAINDGGNEGHVESSAPLSFPLPSSSPSNSTRIVLPGNDVTMTSLRECYGEDYLEVACKPRKFVLDVTSHVRELLKKKVMQKTYADKTEEAVSYLVFVHDGFFDGDHDVYKVFLNCRLQQGMLPITVDCEDLYRGTCQSVISLAMDLVESFLPDSLLNNQSFTTKAAERQLMHHLGQAEAYTPSLQRLFKQGSSASVPAVLPSLDEMLSEEPAFCDVCYDDVSPLTQDSAAATSLLKCRHRVCDSCWSQHIHSRFQQGFVRVTCPGYDCQEEVSVGVLLSVASLDTVDKILQRQEEARIGASRTEKWCPNETCGRILHLQVPVTDDSPDTELTQDVVCACGSHVCFRCLAPAHWPATCKQATEYRTVLNTTSFPDRDAEVYDDSYKEQQARKAREDEAKGLLLVEGKHCPKCKNFVFKNGGCPQMTCRCGQLFCWYCAKPGFSHPNRSMCVSEEAEKKLTTTIIVRHLETKPEEKQKQAQVSKLANRRQRVSLMERASEHRRHRQSANAYNHAVTVMAKAAATAASKNSALAQHIYNVCNSGGAPSSSSSSSSPRSSPSSSSSSSSSPRSSLPSPSSSTTALPKAAFSSLVEKVTSFLRGAVKCKQELHELTEYSLVLVNDLPDSLLRRRALRISEDLGAFCSFMQSILDVWNGVTSGVERQQEAVKAVTRLAEIQGWVNSALATHVATVKKIRNKYA